MPDYTLNKYFEPGFFCFKNAQLFLEDIHLLEKRIKRLKEYRPEIPFYLHLDDIKLISGSAPQKGISEEYEHALSGAMVEYSSRSRRECFIDEAVTPVSSIDESSAPLQFNDQVGNLEAQLIELKEALFALLAQPDTWRSIKLESVFFYKNQQINHDVTQSFYDNLLISLVKNSSLKELSIKPFSLSKHRKSLFCFLTQHSELEALHLGINEASRQDWRELCQCLERHPKLKSLDLNHSVLDANAYSALTNLLDKNYRVEIKLLKPTCGDLLEVYTPLNRRLSKTGLVRFRDHHLTQDKLLQVAVTALESLQQCKLSSIEQTKEQVLLEKQFDFLLTNQGHLLISSSEKEEWIKSAVELPSFYKDHEEYLKSLSRLVKLHVDELVLDGSKTAGYVLLEKALELENLTAMQTLLNARANIFELPINNEDPFLVKVLQSNCALKKVIINYIREQQLFERASEYLAPYPNLIAVLNELKIRLDEHSAHRVKKENQTLLLFLATEVLCLGRKLSGLQHLSDKKGRECKKIYLDLDQGLVIINNAPEDITYGALCQIQILMQRIKEDSMTVLRGLLSMVSLHENMVEFIDRFDEVLEASKKDINDQKDNIIKAITEGREKDRAEFDAKYATLEAQYAKLETRLSSLFKQIASNAGESSQTSNAQHEEKPETSAGFFVRP